MANVVRIHLDKIQQTNAALTTKVSDQVQHIEKLNAELQRFSQNQRAFVAQSLQEAMRLFLLLPSIIQNKTLFIQVVSYIQFFIQQVIYMLQDNKELHPNCCIAVNIDDLIDEHQALFRWLVQNPSNTFSIDLEPGLTIQTDPKQLVQAIIQIILNADKYTNNGHINVSIKQHGQHVIFEIDDSGQGMPQDDINQVLTSLDQNDMRLVDAFSTLGLGLVVVHRFCRNSQSKLICTSVKSSGTTIQIIHPIKSNVSVLPSKNVVIITNNHLFFKPLQSEFQWLPGWGCQLLGPDQLQTFPPYTLV